MECSRWHVDAHWDVQANADSNGHGDGNSDSLVPLHI